MRDCNMRDISEIRRENVKLLIEKNGLSREQFAEKANIAYSLLAHYIGKNPTKNIGRNVANRIEMAFGLSENWLDQDWTMNNQRTGNTLATSNINPNLEPIDDWDSSTPLDDDEVEIVFYKDFSFACGHGSTTEAMANESRRLRMSKATLNRIGSNKTMVFATIAEGDSMSPTINDGATIWIDTTKQSIKDGHIFVFEYGGLFMCKRLYRLPNDGLKVVSDNDIDYPAFEITGEQKEQNGFRLIGWVWHWSVMVRW